MGLYTHTIVTGDGEIDLDIEYCYEAGEPDEYYDQYGNPGTPGYPSSVEITHVWYTLKDYNKNEVTVDILPVFDIILEGDIYNLEEEILDYHENQ